MKILLAILSPRRTPAPGPATDLLHLYIERATRFAPCSHRIFPDEPRLLAFLDQSAARTRPILILTDSRGQQLSSPELAAELSRHLDHGVQLLTLAIGPPDGWSPTALARADLLLAFGRITLPHELAALIAAEQLYRALTIRANHPYHSSH